MRVVTSARYASSCVVVCRCVVASSRGCSNELLHCRLVASPCVVARRRASLCVAASSVRRCVVASITFPLSPAAGRRGPAGGGRRRGRRLSMRWADRNCRAHALPQCAMEFTDGREFCVYVGRIPVIRPRNSRKGAGREARMSSARVIAAAPLLLWFTAVRVHAQSVPWVDLGAGCCSTGWASVFSDAVCWLAPAACYIRPAGSGWAVRSAAHVCAIVASIHLLRSRDQSSRPFSNPSPQLTAAHSCTRCMTVAGQDTAPPPLSRDTARERRSRIAGLRPLHMLADPPAPAGLSTARRACSIVALFRSLRSRDQSIHPFIFGSPGAALWQGHGPTSALTGHRARARQHWAIEMY
eukprot:gene11827-biopygen114553